MSLVLLCAMMSLFLLGCFSKWTKKNNEITNNIYRKVTIPDENKQTKYKKKNNDTRFWKEKF